MRLLNYLSYSGIDEETNKFRTMSIMLVDKQSAHREIVKEISEKYEIQNLLSLVESLNKELRGMYRGKYFFDFCIDEGADIDKLKLGNKQYQKLKILQLEANDSFTSFKKYIEKQLAQSDL